jgi:hypothetical protein
MSELRQRVPASASASENSEVSTSSKAAAKATPATTTATPATTDKPASAAEDSQRAMRFLAMLSLAILVVPLVNVVSHTAAVWRWCVEDLLTTCLRRLAALVLTRRKKNSHKHRKSLWSICCSVCSQHYHDFYSLLCTQIRLLNVQPSCDLQAMVSTLEQSSITIQKQYSPSHTAFHLFLKLVRLLAHLFRGCERHT